MKIMPKGGWRNNFQRKAEAKVKNQANQGTGGNYVKWRHGRNFCTKHLILK